MRRLALLASFALIAFAQTPVRQGDISFSADRIVTDGAVTHLSGNVVIEAEGMVLKADHVDFNVDTLEITARGRDVQLKLHQRDHENGPASQQRQ